MTSSRTDNVVSRRAALTGLAGALGLALAARGLAAEAQDATPAADIPREGHPLVGGWQWDTPGLPGVPIAISVFNASGSFIDDQLGVGAIGIGVWTPTDPRTADIVVVYQGYVPLDPLLDLTQPLPADGVWVPGEVYRQRSSIEVDESGMRAHDKTQFVDDNGNDLSVYNSHEVDGVRLVATVAAATPTP
jgi:hypothetical protein